MSYTVKTTKKAYVAYLNDVALPEQSDEKWIIGGTIRMHYMWMRKYGEALRKYDPIAFEVGYKEWVRENE
jgi:hypothetical protein